MRTKELERLADLLGAFFEDEELTGRERDEVSAVRSYVLDKIDGVRR